jgi:hypothetical protein
MLTFHFVIRGIRFRIAVIINGGLTAGVWHITHDTTNVSSAHRQLGESFHLDYTPGVQSFQFELKAAKVVSNRFHAFLGVISFLQHVWVLLLANFLHCRDDKGIKRFSCHRALKSTAAQGTRKISPPYACCFACRFPYELTPILRTAHAESAFKPPKHIPHMLRLLPFPLLRLRIPAQKTRTLVRYRHGHAMRFRLKYVVSQT